MGEPGEPFAVYVGDEPDDFSTRGVLGPWMLAPEDTELFVATIPASGVFERERRSRKTARPSTTSGSGKKTAV